MRSNRLFSLSLTISLHHQTEDIKVGCHSQYKTMKKVQEAFFVSSKRVRVDLIPTVDGHHLLVGLEEEQKVSPEKPPSKFSGKEGHRGARLGE